MSSRAIIGEKAEPPLVDADQRHAEARQLTGRVEHRSVAAKDDGQIGPLADRGEIATRPVPLLARGSGMAGRHLLDQHRDATREQTVGKQAE